VAKREEKCITNQEYANLKIRRSLLSDFKLSADHGISWSQPTSGNSVSAGWRNSQRKLRGEGAVTNKVHKLCKERHGLLGVSEILKHAINNLIFSGKNQ